MDSIIDYSYNNAIQLLKKKEYIEADKILKYLAKKGDIDAQIKLGYMSFLGLKEIKKNIDNAMYWFKIAFKYNHEAERMLGFCYLEKGEIEKGITHLKNASNRGNLTAIVDLGGIYDYNEYGVEENKKKALKYYTEGCKAKNYEGCKYMTLLLDELKIDKYEYIKNNIGNLKFILIFLKNIFKIWKV